MKEIQVKTGYGYLKDQNGNITSKSELPKGKHKIKDKYTYHEVSSAEELSNIEIYKPPKPPETEEQKEKRLIAQKKKDILDRLAIKELKEEGKIK